jgi:hypothetical protein
MSTGTKDTSYTPSTVYDAEDRDAQKALSISDSPKGSTTIHSSPRATNSVSDAPASAIEYTNESGTCTPTSHVTPETITARVGAASRALNNSVELGCSPIEQTGADALESNARQQTSSSRTVPDKKSSKTSKSKSVKSDNELGNIPSTGKPNKEQAEASIAAKWLRKLLNDFGNKELTATFDHFEGATTKPPITRQSLAELDIKPIANNAKLRQDINFDRELHFRPNNEGQRGKLKRVAHESYWCAITAEIELYIILGSGNPQIMCQALPLGMTLEMMVKASQKRLPTMFKTIKEILEHLVPPRDVSRVQEGLDEKLIMQEVNMQMFDFTTKAEWLSELLKTHCAPMRDRMIDGMLDLIRKRDSRCIAQGLCELFAVLEAMKLDIANHQIRHLRALLIEDTTTFGRKYHVKRIKQNRFRTDKAIEWFKRSREELVHRQVQSDFQARPQLNPKDDFDVFVDAFVDLVLPNKQKSPPETFALDADRIRDIKNEIQEEIYAGICYKVFAELYKDDVEQDCVVPTSTQIKLKETIRLIVGDHDIQSAVPYLAVCIASQIQELKGADASIINSQLIEVAEQHLVLRLPLQGHEFCEQQEAIEQHLFRQVLLIGKKYITVQAWDLFNALVPATTPPLPLLSSALPPPPPNEPHTWLNHPSFARTTPYSDLAHKMAHIAILHFRLWGPLVYCESDETLVKDSETLQNSSTTPTRET